MTLTYEGPASEAPGQSVVSGAGVSNPSTVGVTDVDNDVAEEQAEGDAVTLAAAMLRQLLADEAEELAEGEGSTGPVAILLQVLDLLDQFTAVDAVDDAQHATDELTEATGGRSVALPTVSRRNDAPSVIVRSWDHAPTEIRSAADGSDIMTGHFAVFNEWTEINSRYEGNFMERIAPQAFVDTIAKRAKQIRVLYDHGADPQIGNKPLGEPIEMRADSTGVAYKVRLFDTPYVNDLKPALRAGQLGASFRMKVLGEQWDNPTRSSDLNPNMLPERTITAIELYEFGPVTFPAYAGATAGLRSRTDWYVDELLHDPKFIARFTAQFGPKVAERLIASAAEGRAVNPTKKRGEAGKTVTPTINRYALFAKANGLLA